VVEDKLACRRKINPPVKVVQEMKINHPVKVVQVVQVVQVVHPIR